MAGEIWQYSQRQAVQGTPAGAPLPPPLPPDAVAILDRLGFAASDPAPCFGYANACTCWRCADRQDRFAALCRAGAEPARAASLAKRDSAAASARRAGR